MIGFGVPMIVLKLLIELSMHTFAFLWEKVKKKIVYIFKNEGGLHDPPKVKFY